jgi:hypothetical protein
MLVQLVADASLGLSITCLAGILLIYSIVETFRILFITE